MKIGDLVFAHWQKRGRWYPGSIEEIDAGRFHVHYEDDDREWVASDCLVPQQFLAPSKLAVGAGVLARWNGGPFYYPGVVTACRGDGQIHIRYDDGCEEWTALDVVPLHADPLPVDGAPAPLAEKEVAPMTHHEFQVGDMVMVRWKKGIVEYRGQVKKKNGHRLFIKFDDNDEEWTTPEWVRAAPAVVPGAGGPARNDLELMKVPLLAGSRLFPPVAAGFYDVSPTAGENDADPWRSLTQTRLRWGQKYLGWGLDAEKQLSRLFLLHRLGLQAELAGSARRADFFWRELERSFASLANRESVWETLANSFSGRSLSPNEVRHTLVREVFLETHCAFYNGLAEGRDKLAPGSRALVHARRCRVWCALAGLTAEEQFALLDGPARAEIDVYRLEKNWDGALAVVRVMETLCPFRIEYEDCRADLLFSKGLAALHQGATPDVGSVSARQQQLADAATLQHSIHEMEQFRQQHPHNSLPYELLGHLYHLRAIKLANGGAVSTALVEVAKALAFYPNLSEAVNTRETLRALMVELKSRVEALEWQLRCQPFSTLTFEGQQLQAEARRGSKPANVYEQSAEARQATAAYSAAQGRSLWRQVGLPKPADHWDAHANLLVKAIGALLTAHIPDRATLKAYWSSVASAYPELAGSEESVCRFLGRRLFGPEKPHDPPILHAGTPIWSRGEPLDFWLFSGRDLGAKVLATAAVVLLGFITATTVREVGLRQERDRHYQAVVTAVARGEDQAVVDSAGAFLAAVPLLGQDQRQPQVQTLAGQARTELTNRPKREAAFVSLQEAAKRQDDDGYAKAAKDFLAAAPPNRTDERAPAVGQLHDEITKDPWSHRKVRAEAYQAFVKALEKQDQELLERAAAKFLKALPIVGEDQRTSQVRAQLKQVVDDPWRDRAIRERTYGRIIAAANHHELWLVFAEVGSHLAGGPFAATGLPPGVAEALSVKIDQQLVTEADQFLAVKRLDPRTGQVETLRLNARVHPTWPRRVREQSYLALVKGVADQDDAAVFQAAMLFLDQPGADPRNDQVRAIKKRFEGDPAARRQARDQAYQEFVNAAKRGRDADLLSAAEGFLAARPTTHKDERTDQVKQQYRETFVRWFVALTPSELKGAEAKDRLARFSLLVPESN